MKESKMALREYGAIHAFGQSIDRKGIPVESIHIPLRVSWFSKLSTHDQKMIALNLVGGFQTNAL